MTESQIILYTTPDGDIKVDTVLAGGRKLYALRREMSREATVSKMETVQNETASS